MAWLALRKDLSDTWEMCVTSGHMELKLRDCKQWLTPIVPCRIKCRTYSMVIAQG